MTQDDRTKIHQQITDIVRRLMTESVSPSEYAALDAEWVRLEKQLANACERSGDGKANALPKVDANGQAAEKSGLPTPRRS